MAPVAPKSGPTDGARRWRSKTSASTTGISAPSKTSTMPIARNRITAIIGPSGCGKSTLIRCLNRMNDLIPRFRAEGEVLFEGENLYDRRIDPVEVRRRIGMVFQKPNPFPKSIYDNVAFGARINGYQGQARTRSSSARCGGPRSGTRSRTSSSRARSPSPAASSSASASPARWPSSPRSSSWTSLAAPSTRSPRCKIEDLMRELAQDYTIVIVTHNMQQAARVSDSTAVMMMGEDRAGEMVEFGPTHGDLHEPEGQADRGLHHRPLRLASQAQRLWDAAMTRSPSNGSSARSRRTCSSWPTWSRRPSSAPSTP